MTIIDAIHDENLFKPFFRDLDTWRSWFIVLRSIFGLPMSKEEFAIFIKLTGRTTPPTEQAREACGSSSAGVVASRSSWP